MNESLSCNLCDKQIAENGICHRCHSKIHRQLDDIYEFWLTAHDELLPGRSGSGGRSSERTIGLNVAALSFITGSDILGLLHEWEKLIRQDRNLTRPAFLKKESLAIEISNAIKFAQTHLQWSATQPWIGDFAKELKNLHSLGMSAAKCFLEKTRKIECPAETSEGICNNLLKINEQDPMEIFECRKCQSQWTTLRLVAVALSDPNRKVWLDAEAIAKWIGVSERHVRRIAQRNNISKKGNLYDVNGVRVAYAQGA